MVRVTMIQTWDGKMFQSEKEAESHEQDLIAEELEEILDFARWEERGAEYRLHFQHGQVWMADVRTPVHDGVLHGTRIPLKF